MSVAFDHRDSGTPEADWQSAPLAAQPLILAARHLLVLAAHPDDETLGAGGLIATAAGMGLDITVIIATDGEASHPGSPGLAVARRQEAVAALGELAPTARLRFLALPDGGLREHAAALATAIEQELTALDRIRTVVATTWWGDGHRDHRVLGETALAVADGAVVIGYPIWYWHWGDPRHPEPASWRSLSVDASAREAKERALAQYASQLAEPAPILHEGMLAHFRRGRELFIEAGPDRAGSVPAAHFDEFIRRREDPWGFESRWYEQRKREILLACLPRPRYRSVLELGCATGVLTELLAARCDRMLAVDGSHEALTRAAARVTGATFEQRMVPEDWPEGVFDLIVLSELGYYLSAADLTRTRDRIESSLSAEGMLVACHWRHPIDGAPLTGDAVHAVLRGTRLTRLVLHEEDDFLLEVWAAPGVPSVGAAEGLS